MTFPKKIRKLPTDLKQNFNWNHGIAERQRGRVLLVSCVIERARRIFCTKLPARSQSEGKMASFLQELTPFVCERR